MKNLILLFWSFLKIGAFSFGGGYAMITLIEREIVDHRAWITSQEFRDIIGISQMTPGPVSINSATFVGYKIGGVLGSLCATLGVVTVSFTLVFIVSHYLIKFKESKIVKSALLGMRPTLIGLIISAVLSLSKGVYSDIKSIVIVLITLGLLLWDKIHPIIIIIISAVMGIIFYGYL
ncbi:chromate transporter [Clostridium cochlearium]|uniref:chromate transporter n=1 Tax=Clostridium cochlearium TaxID=1494 RepID=UPI000BBC1574|nr:chromate transporter [Clostridium cochlearium]MCR1971893.1 chromate transporter [Clostridium cochlearium]NMA58136.1 chromate transporter [Clostridium cochlearium]